MSKFQRRKRLLMFKAFLFGLLHDPLNAFVIAKNAGDSFEQMYRVFNMQRRAKGITEEWLG